MLLPKEHGAYFQLAVPIATALAMGRPTVSGLLFASAATAAFLGHESLLVIIGARGAAAARRDGPHCLRTLIGLAVVAVGAGALAWVDALSKVGAVPIIPLALATVMAAIIAARRERSAFGELVAAAALTSAALPVAYASGVPAAQVWSAWATWLLVMGAGTSAVRAVIAAQKGTTTWATRGGATAVFVLATSLLASQWPWAAVAAAPSIGICIALTLMPPHPRVIRRVGWLLAAATVFAATILAVAVRRDAGIASDVVAAGSDARIPVSTTKGNSR